MDVRTQRKIDNYVGRLGIAVLRPAAMLLGKLLRRDHRLSVDKEVVWIKMLGGGSLILALPMLLGFRRAYPATKMVLITTPAVKAFAELMGVFDEYRVIDNGSAWGVLWTGARALFQTLRADCIVDLEVHSRLTTVFTTLTLARNRVSFWLEDIFWRRGLASHLVFFNRASGSYHFYDRIGDLFGVTPAGRTECRDAVKRACGMRDSSSEQAATGTVYVGFACSDLGQERMLTPDQWVRVFRAHLRPTHERFVLLGGPSDKARGDEIRAALHAAFPNLTLENSCGSSSLGDSVTRLLRGTEFWGIDSSLLHFSRIGGLRCLSYWGPTDPATRLRETWRDDVHETVVYRKIACSPCVHTSETPPCGGDNRCIKGLFEPAHSASNWTPMEFPKVRRSSRQAVAPVAAAIGRNIGFICVAVMAVYLAIHAFDPPRLNWGDSGSDYNVMTAGRNFQKYGFLKMRLTPHLLEASLLNPADPSKIYTHYPQLPDLMNGVYRVVLHLSDLTQFRFVALAFSFAALFFIYRLIAHYWSRRTAQIALGLWVINPLWIQHADHLHAVPYGAFFGYGAVYFLVRYLGDERRRGFLVASGAFLFFVYLSSYDYWFFAPLLLAIVTVAHFRGVRAPAIRVLSVLALFAVASIAAKLATNAWVLGGVGALMTDLRFQLVERTANPAMHIPIAPGIWPTLVGRVERCFSLLLFPIALYWAAVAFFPRAWAARGPLLERTKANPWIVLFAGLPFLCVFVELWIGQYYPTLLVMPFYVVGSAALAGRFLDTKHRYANAIAIALIGALFANSISEDLSFKKAFVDRTDVRELRARLDSVSRPGQYVLTNNVFDFFYSYYFDRPTVDLILNPPDRMPAAVAYYSDPRRPRVAPPSGAIFVQQKHLADEMYDKGFYFLLAREGLWKAWANPERYHAAINAFITTRDSELVAAVTPTGTKLYETDSYVIWRIAPRLATQAAADTPRPVAVAAVRR